VWHWSRKSAQLAIERDRITLFKLNGKASAPQPVRTHPICGLPSVADALQSCLSSIQATTSTVRISVSDFYARFWIAHPPAEATTRLDLSTSALWRFEELFGESAATWNIQADWKATRPFIACGLPRLLTDAIAAAASANRIGVVSCLPRFVAEWNDHRRQLRRCDSAWLVAEWNDHRRQLRRCDSAWLVALADSTATIALLRRREIDQIQQIRCHAGSDVDLDALTAALRALSLQAGHACASTVMLCGDVPDEWHAVQNKEYRFERVAQTAPALRLIEPATIERLREQAQ